MSAKNKYDRSKHDSYISCPRNNCTGRNAPAESDDFKPNCWKCGNNLGVQPVSIGDIVTVEVFETHESGRGLGRTEDGFIVFLPAVLPEKTVKAKITNVNDTSANAELIEVVKESIDSEEDEEDNEERYGRRDNYWGGA